jgi:hypothetical protein
LIPIVEWNSTIIMNFIAYFGIVCLYPTTTRSRVGWVNLRGDPTPRDQKWIDKYTARGYSLYEGSNLPGPWAPHRCGVDDVCTVTVRNLLDDGVEVLPFKAYGGESHRTLLKTLEPVFVWKLRNTSCVLGKWGKKGFVRTAEEHYNLV